MKNLAHTDLLKVHPRLRPMVLQAWAAGEDVPAGVKYISFKKPTAKEIEHAMKNFQNLRKKCSRKNTKAKNNPQTPLNVECQAKSKLVS
jgi:type II secretory pathway component PulM